MEPKKVSGDQNSNNSFQEKVFQWGLGLIVLGIVGLLLPTLGLQLRRLQALGEVQWVVLFVAVVAGSGAVLWARRTQPKIGAMIAGGAISVALLFAYLSFWRQAGDSPVAQGDSNVAANGDIAMLEVTFENVRASEDFELLMELMKDAVPEATNSGGQWQGSSDPATGKFVAKSQQFHFGPVKDVDAVVKRIQFGKPKRKGTNKLVVEVQYPLPPKETSIHHRVDYGLQELRSGDAQRQEAGLQVFELLEPLDRRDEVATELASMLTKNHPSHRVPFCLQRWGTPNQVPAVLKLLGSESAKPHELLPILSVISPDDAAREAIKLMPNDPTNLGVETLRKLGPRAEDPVLPLLSHTDENMQRAACWVLQVVGTAKSLEPLEKLQSTASPNISAEAKQAVELIQKRAAQSGASKGT